MTHALRDSRLYERLLVDEETKGHCKEFPERKALLMDFVSKLGCKIAQQINPQDIPYLHNEIKSIFKS